MRTYRTLTLRALASSMARKLASFVLAGVTGTAMLPGAASGEPISLLGEQAPTQESSFSLDFGAFGGVASARIAQTQFALELDPEAGLARFENYTQHVEPLTLPGGFSTGNIRVEIVPGSSDGTFNSLTGEFETSESYAIYFDGDLSAFGLTSPVVLPSNSLGAVTVSAVEGGIVSMDWSGIGQLANPFNPLEPILFEYTCSVAAEFAPQPVSLVSLALIPDVLNLGLPVRLESTFLRSLESALTSIESGRGRVAAVQLGVFVRQVEIQRGRKLSDEQADSLTSDAQGAILLLRSGEVSGVREVRPIQLGLRNSG